MRSQRSGFKPMCQVQTTPSIIVVGINVMIIIRRPWSAYYRYELQECQTWIPGMLWEVDKTD